VHPILLIWYTMCTSQVRVMTALRHPNVVLFMAASTKAPKMCIVMEYMALGCLFDVRTNPPQIDLGLFGPVLIHSTSTTTPREHSCCTTS
jgi:serine/threonine protein kinase